jgi:porin
MTQARATHGRRLCGISVAALTLVAAVPAWAQTAAAPMPQDPTDPSFWTGLFAPSRTNLLNDMFGLRTALGNDGISLGLQETSEVLGNVTGGTRRTADYDGLTEISLGIDTQKAFGWDGGTFNVSALQIHGRDLSTDSLQTLQTASGIEANRATRLWELWYQQAFLDGKIDVKVGQQSIDQEFLASQYSGLFINTMMGWPMLPSADLYAGGPAYPLSSPGVRLRAQPTGAITLLAGVFDDNPPGGPFNSDSQVRGAEQSGAAFNLRTGALVFAEVQYAVNQPSLGQMATAGQPSGLAGTYKLGAWYDSAQFPDQHLDSAGLSLADPAGSGIPLLHRGNYSVYGVVDQMVWQPDPQGPQSLGVFVRAMGAPDDRNLINFSVNAGLSLKAPMPTRDNDTVGLGYGFAKVSSSASALDKDAAVFSGQPMLVRSSESFAELTYQYQIAPWWQAQPDIQYVFLPGGGIANPASPGQRIGNELVLGLRTAITF